MRLERAVEAALRTRGETGLRNSFLERLADSAFGAVAGPAAVACFFGIIAVAVARIEVGPAWTRAIAAGGGVLAAMILAGILDVPWSLKVASRALPLSNRRMFDDRIRSTARSAAAGVAVAATMTGLLHGWNAAAAFVLWAAVVWSLAFAIKLSRWDWFPAWLGCSLLLAALALALGAALDPWVRWQVEAVFYSDGFATALLLIPTDWPAEACLRFRAGGFGPDVAVLAAGCVGAFVVSVPMRRVARRRFEALDFREDDVDTCCDVEEEEDFDEEAARRLVREQLLDDAHYLSAPVDWVDRLALAGLSRGDRILLESAEATRPGCGFGLTGCLVLLAIPVAVAWGMPGKAEIVLLFYSFVALALVWGAASSGMDKAAAGEPGRHGVRFAALFPIDYERVLELRLRTAARRTPALIVPLCLAGGLMAWLSGLVGAWECAWTAAVVAFVLWTGVPYMTVKSTVVLLAAAIHGLSAFLVPLIGWGHPLLLAVWAALLIVPPRAIVRRCARRIVRESDWVVARV